MTGPQRGLRGVLRRIHSGERGITLIELIVAMALSLIVVTAAAGFLASGQKSQVTVNKIDQNTRVSSTAMNEIGRMLRGATENPEANTDPDAAFITASPTTVKFYAFVNLTSTTAVDPEIVQFQVTGGQLWEYTWAGTQQPAGSGYWTYAGTPTTSRILANAVASSSTSPFTYLANDAKTVLDGSVQANLDDIRYVTVNLEIGSTTVGAYQNVVNSTTIVLPNVLQENS